MSTLNLPTDIKDVTIQNYINGQWFDASNGKTIPNFSPVTGQPIAPIPDSGQTDADAAVAAAKAAQPAWAALSVAERTAYLRRIADLIEANNQLLAEFESLDQGKPVKSAAMMDFPACSGYFRQFSDYVEAGIEEYTHSFNGVVTTSSVTQPRRANFDSRTQRVPAGVVVGITPWNFPCLMVCEKLGPALALGNTAIVKPTELTSVTPYLLTKIIDAAGVPPGVINILFGTGQDAGAPLVKHKDVRAVSFTGGSLTGSKIGAMAGGLYKRVSLELGGKNPSVIFDDCDFDHAVLTSIRGAYQNQGEICLCTSRVYVQRSIYDKFLDAFRQKVLEQVRVGNPSDPQTFYGPVVSAQHQEKVTGYIRLAQQEGANVEFLINPADKAVKKIAADGKLTIDGFEGGYYIAPTLITDISQKSRVMQEEIFGPVVAVLPFDTEEEGVALANDTEYGLGAVVWTEDKQRLARVQNQINSGMVWGNCWLSWDDEMPFGGMGCSGTSREHGKWSLDFYTELKAIYTYNE
ncbi:hypothetical protein EC988_000990 [Linderina pennispora]|nr:hypothetical protein EC988_000990 [Linderina pennispora]